MMKWKSSCIAASLAAVLLIPSAAIANESSDFGKFSRDHGGDHVHVKHASLMQERVHRQYYITLLSEKYTPEKTKEWQEVFAERERLMKEIKALHGEVDGHPGANGPTDAQKQARREEMKKWHEQKAALYQEFTEAIRSQDQAKIKNVLPRLLEQTKLGNQHIAERIAAMKKK